MVYEWDERRARRAYFTRVGMMLGLAVVAVAVPAVVALAMMN
jgi:hypothetical protein